MNGKLSTAPSVKPATRPGQKQKKKKQIYDVNVTIDLVSVCHFSYLLKVVNEKQYFFSLDFVFELGIKLYSVFCMYHINSKEKVVFPHVFQPNLFWFCFFRIQITVNSLWKSYFSFSQKREIKEEIYFLIKHNQFENHSFSLYLSGPIGIKNLCNFAYSLWHVYITLVFAHIISIDESNFDLNSVAKNWKLQSNRNRNKTLKQPSQSAKTRNELSTTYFLLCLCFEWMRCKQIEIKHSHEKKTKKNEYLIRVSHS